MGDCLQTGLAM